MSLGGFYQNSDLVGLRDSFYLYITLKSWPLDLELLMKIFKQIPALLPPQIFLGGVVTPSWGKFNILSIYRDFQKPTGTKNVSHSPNKTPVVA